MKKIIIIILLILTVIPVNANININSANAIVINLNDSSILYEKNSEEKTYIASLTKIMTTIVALEHFNNLQETITITDEMLQGIYEYSKAGLKNGDILTIDDLLYATMLPSGADAVQAIEITLGGREKFAELMNKKAKELGMKNTNFSNGVGMDENNFSTVKDVSILLQYALKNEKFYKIYTTKKHTLSNGLDVFSTLSHHAIDTSKLVGSKTGFTDYAGLCMSAIYVDDTYKYLIVTTNANYTDGEPYHILDALTIINYYLDNYHYLNIYEKGDTISSIPILNSHQKNYNIKAEEDIKLLVEKNLELKDLELEIKQINEINNIKNKGTYLGTLNIKHDNKIFFTKDFILTENIKYKINSDVVIIIVLTIFIILLLIYNVLLRKKIHRLIIRLKYQK